MISKLCSKIANIAKDKFLHFAIAYILFDYYLSISQALNLGYIETLAPGVIIISCIIIAKEIIDEKEYNGWDWKDILASYIGVGTKLLAFLISNL